MYIPEFWAGVVLTLFVEFLLILVMIIISTHGKDKDL